jgi:8-hydroxy-5-deazaflavin:NADPH oxidoreductase
MEGACVLRIGIIGAGNIGGTLAAKFAGAGHRVRLANSRGPESLVEVAHATGSIAATIADAARQADAVIVAVPYKAIRQLPRDIFAETSQDAAVIDTGNYYPTRDGTIDALDGPITDTEWVAGHFERPIVKAFNSISVNSLRSKGMSAGSPSRIALPVSGDHQPGKRLAFGLVDEAGFTPVDAGSLAESWRQQPGTAAYTTDLDEAGLRKALDRLTSDDRALQPERRERNLQMILALKDGPGSDQAVHALRTQWNVPAPG